MKMKWKCIGGSVVLTLSFVFCVGIVSSIGMAAIQNGFEHIAAHICGNIGGCVPTIASGLAVGVQYAAAIAFLLAAILFCAAFIRKKEN